MVVVVVIMSDKLLPELPSSEQRGFSEKERRRQAYVETEL